MFLKILGPVKAKRGVWQQFPKTQSCAAGGQHCGCPRTLLGRQKLLFSDDGFFLLHGWAGKTGINPVYDCKIKKKRKKKETEKTVFLSPSLFCKERNINSMGLNFCMWIAGPSISEIMNLMVVKITALLGFHLLSRSLSNSHIFHLRKLRVKEGEKPVQVHTAGR